MSTEQIIPIGEYVLISAIEETNTSSSGLVLSTAKPSENRGLIKAVGDKVNTDDKSTPICVNDVVIFIPGNDIKVTNSEESDRLVSVKNIIGIIKGE